MMFPDNMISSTYKVRIPFVVFLTYTEWSSKTMFNPKEIIPSWNQKSIYIEKEDQQVSKPYFSP